MSDLQELVAAWLGSDPWQVRHVARNLLLDAPALTEPEHPDLVECGDRLSPAAVAALERLSADLVAALAELENELEEPEEVWLDLRRRLEREARSLRKRVLEGSAGRDGRAVMVRYVSCQAFYDYWYQGPPDPSHDVERVRERITAALDHPRKLSELNAQAPAQQGEPLSLAGSGRVVWVTEGEPEMPHRRPGVGELDGHERALATVRLMGLSGYDGTEARRRAIGMICAHYPLDTARLRIPTAVTGLDYPYFFPGFKHESSGRVASLAEDMSSPWQRAPENSTIPEWIHDNLTLEAVQPTVELVGFFED